MSPHNSPPATVPAVDPDRYAGLWYEIARYPKWFEKHMTRVTAEYSAEKDYIRVINKGYRNGRLHIARGKARVVEGTGNAVLSVTFFAPFSGDYRIIRLDPDYRYAVVSDKKRASLWILSRTPQLDKPTLDAILSDLEKDHFALDRIEFTDWK